MSSVWKNRPDGRTVRRNKIAGQWAWLPREALKSPAYRALSLSGHRVLARIQLEQLYHAGKDNGRLPVTFRDFHKYGVRWESIAPAIRELVALGFVRITQYGVASAAEFRAPNMFALTHLPTKDDQVAGTNDWRRIMTVEEAEAIAAAARKAPAQLHKFSRKRRSAKTDLRYRSGIDPEYRNGSAKPETPNTETVSLSGSETVSLSISRVVAEPSIPPAAAPEPVPIEPAAFPAADDWRRNSKTAPERLDGNAEPVPSIAPSEVATDRTRPIPVGDLGIPADLSIPEFLLRRAGCKQT